MEFNFMSDIFVPYLLPAIGLLLSGLGTWLATVIINWLNSKIKNKEVAAMLTLIVNIVSNAVKATYQTYVENIKGTEAWTPEAQKEALNRALTIARSQLSADARKFIEEQFGDVDSYLLELIESILYDLKNGKKETTDINIEK